MSGVPIPTQITPFLDAPNRVHHGGAGPERSPHTTAISYRWHGWDRAPNEAANPGRPQLAARWG